MSEKTNFIEMCLHGKAAVSQIDDWIDRWHESGARETLAEFLGFTSDEYVRWVEQRATVDEILASHRQPAAASTTR
jgi:hypothetical protein